MTAECAQCGGPVCANCGRAILRRSTLCNACEAPARALRGGRGQRTAAARRRESAQALLAKGWTARAVAVALDVSTRTVERYRKEAS